MQNLKLSFSKRIYKFALVLFLVCFTACNSQKIKRTFDKENAFELLEKQCEIGYRFPGSEEIEICRDFIIAELEKNRAENIERQKFTVEVNNKEIKGENIIASYYPRRARRIMLSCHYDTRPWADMEEGDKKNEPVLGANDGASGVAVLLEISRHLSEEEPLNYGIDLVFFDLEDMGTYGDDDSWCLGSRFFAENFKGKKPELAVNVDMVGDKDLKIPMEYYSYNFVPKSTNKIWQTAKDLEFKEFKHSIGNAVIDDHYSLLQSGFKAVNIIDFNYDYWHTVQDTPDKCSPQSLYVVGQTLLQYIYQK